MKETLKGNFTDKNVSEMERVLYKIDFDIEIGENEYDRFRIQKEDVQKRLDDYNKDLNDINNSEYFGLMYKTDLSENTEKLKTNKEKKHDIELELNKVSNEIKELENDIQKFNQSRENAIAIQKNEKEIKRIEDIINGEIGSGVQPDQDFVLEERYLEGNYAKYNAKVTELIKRSSSIEATISNYKKQVRDKENELKREEAKANDLIKSGNDPSVIDNLRCEISEARQNYYNVESLVRIYSKFVSEIQGKNECPTCFRRFSDGENDTCKDSALKCLNEMIEAFGAERDRLESPEDLEEKEKTLHELESKAEPVRRLIEDVIPRLKSEIAMLNGEIESKAKELEFVKRDENRCKRLEKFLGDCKKYSAKISLYRSQNSILREKIDMGIYRTGDESILNRMEGRLNELKKREETLTEEKASIEEKIEEIVKSIESSREDIKEMEANELKKGKLKEDIERSEREIAYCLEKMGELETNKERLNKEREEHSKDLTEERDRVSRGTKEITTRLNKITVLENQFTKSVNDINYLNGCYKENLERQRSQMAKLHSIDIEKLRTNIQKLESTDKTLNNTLDKRSQKDSELKSIKNAIEVKKYEKEYHELGKYFNEEEYNNAVERKKECEQRMSFESGSLSSLESTLRSNKVSLLKIKDHETIDRKIREVHVEIITREKTAVDLDMYKKGLEGAIMRYHETQMDQINSVIRDLWQETYCRENWHEDIDYLKIVSDLEPTDGRGSYRYRVVMVKDGKEIDMRGRCSAGQKVLASLVIRMAIAEVFCVNCGVFAIDEPSTNLDEHNSIALARALSDLIEKRKGISSFQLIVITHDPIFVDILGYQYCGNFYYEVSKNERTGKSTIKRKRIEEITR